VTVADWADRHRVLPRGSAEPGPWRSARVPYFIPIMEAATSPRYRRIVVVCGSQMSKTEFLLNLLGYRLDVDPAPVLFVGASQRQVESISTSRVMPMVRSTPTLHAKLDKRKTANKVTEKTIAGQRLGFAWAGSAIELSSHPAALVLIDERDRMGGDVGGEGDPVALAEARTATYVDGKVVVVSTPTVEGASPIWALYQSGTQFRWSWPCPHCETYFVPEFSLLKWPEKATPQQAKREARLACPHCGALIDDRHRPGMNAAGRFELAGDPDADCASYWVSGLASPWRSWGEAAKQWLEAARSDEPGRAQAIMNTTFGELFRVAGEAPPAADVQKLRAGYRSDELPATAAVLTAGVDVQADRLVYAIRGWGAASTSHLIRHGELWGDTNTPSPWEMLAELLEHDWNGKRLKLVLVDSGYRPELAYAFSRRFPGRVLPSKGHDSQSKPVYISQVDVNAKGERRKRGVRLAHVDAGYFKSWIHGRIAWPIDQPGAWHLPIDATDDYCEQIVAEQRIARAGTVRWIRTRKANHYLDAEVLNAAAAHLLEVHLLKTRPRAPAVVASEDAPAVPAPARQRSPLEEMLRQRRRPGRGGNWVTGYRNNRF
jgi:phage terminase large subunit GpA-like protein